MAELTSKEFLQPSLLDRLTDLNPAARTDTVEERVITLRRLRESVIRDIEWLLNTSCLGTSAELEDYPEVRRSVLNYGVPDVSGSSVGSKDAAVIEQEIRQAILDFEPRILPETLKVGMTIDKNELSNKTLTLEIHGEL